MLDSVDEEEKVVRIAYTLGGNQEQLIETLSVMLQSNSGLLWSTKRGGKAGIYNPYIRSKSGSDNVDRKWSLRDLDYQSLSKIVQAGHTKSKKYIYKLSLSCMEWFIARKVRAVFDIYRVVTHKAHDVFTNYSNIADHQKKNVQVQNSITA